MANRRECRSPFPQRYLEPGDWVMVIREKGMALADPPEYNGVVAVIDDYGVYPGEYSVKGVPFKLHHRELLPVDDGWSCI